MSTPIGIVVGVDIGGTFTDFAVLDVRSGRLRTGKCLTTSDDPSRGLLQGIESVCRTAGLTPADLDRVSHATTLVTNAIIERKGAKTGLLLTAGFRDILVMGRESRYDHYDFKFDRPEPLVPRSLTCEIDERIAWNGSVLHPLVEDSIHAGVRDLAGRGIRALAVCLLHAYRNPVHEHQVTSVVRQAYPDIDVSVSSAVAPEIREYERASTTVANAYVAPVVRSYLAGLDLKLRERGFRNQVHIMLSNGGISSTEVASAFPIQLIESGPAAGALAASHYAQQLGIDRAIAFDMGGTTAKLCAIENGILRHANAFEAARARRFKRGSGMPLLIPVIELMEIGAGGGSIAHVDPLGLLKVGPHSAGANPGPASYRLGGVSPTVTDADVVLGYIDPIGFLGGEMPLDDAAAAASIDKHVAAPLGLTRIEAAWGIFSVVNESMVAAARRHTAERGIDTRDATLITFGGAAPVHAWQVARILGMRDIFYPFGAGVTSAVGLCLAAPVVNLSRSHVGRLDHLDWHAISRMYDEMQAQATAMLVSAGARPDDLCRNRSVDIRYQGQGYEVEVPIDDIDLLGVDASDGLVQRFETTYARTYGRTLAEGSLEALTWRFRAAGQPFGRRLELSLDVRPGIDPVIGKRSVYFGPAHGHVDCPVYDRYRMAAGLRGIGPALVQERETTVVIEPHAHWAIDQYRNLRVTLADDIA